MPKTRPQRRIDRNVAQVARNITITGGGVGGGPITSHTHPSYITETEADALITSAIAEHGADPNVHHNRQHSIFSTSDHTITADAYSLVGAILDDTLGTLVIAGSGDGIDVDKSGGTFTFNVDVTDIFGDGLTEDGSNNLKVRAGDGIALAGGFVTVDESYDYDWTGDHTWTGDLSSSPWVSGDLGTGWGIDTSAGSADFRSVYAESIVAKAFVVDATIVEKGSITLTPQRATLAADFDIPASITASATLTVYDIEGLPGAAAFTSGTYVRLRVLSRASGLVVGDSWGTVTSYSDQGDGTQTWTWTLRSGLTDITVYAGSVALGYGSSGSGLIDMTTVQADSPYIDVSTWVSVPYVGSNHTTHARLGNLDGITDADIGALSGWGLYTDQLVARGTIVGAGGDVVVDDSTGVNLQARTTSSDSVTYATELSWTTDPFAPASARDVARMYAAEYSSGGLVYHKATLALPSDGSDQQRLFLTTTGSASERAYVQLDAGTTNRLILSSVGSDGSSGGELQLLGDNVLLGNLIVRPVADSTTALGTSEYRFSELWVDTIYAGTTSSTDTGHNHDDRYYTESETDTLLSAKSDTTHTHAGYASSTHTHDDRYYTESEIDATLGDYYTSAEVDSALSAYSLVGHTHDSRYYTESEIDATLSGYVTSSGLSTTLDDYYTSAEVDTALSGYVTSSGLSTTLGDYYTSAEADALLALKAAISHTHAGLTSEGAGITFTNNVGTDIVQLLDTGALRSLTPEYSTDGDGGWELTPTVQRFTNIIASGSISSTVFEYQQVQVGVGSQLFTKGGGGKLKSEFRIDSASVAAVEMDIEDPQAGHIQLFSSGDTLRLRGLATSEPRDSGASYDATIPGLSWIGADQTEQTASRDVWLEVGTVTDNGTYYTYEVTYAGGNRGVFRFQAGGAVANYGADGDGGIEISADQDGAPWMKIFRLDTSGGTPTTIPTVLTGRLDVLPFIATEQYGQALGTNLNSSTAARIVTSDQGISAYKLDYTANDGTYDTVSISSSGRVKFGTNVDSANTTAFDFNPSADTLDISATVTLLDDSQMAGDVTLISGATFQSTDLDQNPSTYSWWMNPQGLRFDVSAGGLEEDDTVADYSAGSGTYTPRIEFYDGLWLTERATLRTITDSDGGDYGGGVISTDLVAHPDSSGYEVGVRLMAAADYGAAAQASIGVFYREDNVPRAEVSAGVFDVTALLNVNGYTALNGGALINLLNSYLILSNVPTSSSGLPSGAVWSNSGVLTIVS